MTHDCQNTKRKGKEEYLYSAILADTTLTKHSDMDQTVLPKLHNVCLSLVSVHQMAPPRLRQQTSNCSLLLIYRPRKDEKLSCEILLNNKVNINKVNISDNT